MCEARQKGFVHLLLLLVALGVAGCGEPLATSEPVYLQVAGSTSMSPLVGELASAFGEQSPNVHVDVTGLGSQYGLDALEAGQVDVAMVSWLPSNLDPRWQAVPIAREGIAIVVHPSNPLDGLGLLQLQDLFSGRAYEWRAVGGPESQGQVQPISREEGSGTRTAFETLAMEDRDVTPLAIVVSSSQAVVDYVAAHPQAIGYVSMGTVSPEVKELKIEGVLPTPKAAAEGSYPLTREFWLVAKRPPSDAVGSFLDFVQRPAGQQVVGEHYGRIK
jgi:phosphate transport system substrate-binding protein